MELIEYKGKKYPSFQAAGFAAKYVFPFAKEFCQGLGVDIGCNRIEWALPGAIPVDLTLQNEYDAFNLPSKNLDYIFSSHCLEHLPNWVDAMDHWTKCLKWGGTLFLYLPHVSQIYWRAYNNRKHLWNPTEEVLRGYLEDRGYQNILITGPDLNCSFCVVAEKGV
jgi:SAM-dependent methyltransferase